MMKKKLMLCAIALCSTLFGAQAADETFTVCTYNIDGLPTKLNVLGLEITIKANGTGSDGTVKIGKYLAEKGYDIIGVNEDFQYHEELMQNMDEEYSCGTWQGPIDASETMPDLPLKMDGLNLLWKDGIKAENETLTTFTNAYGLFDHENDSLVSKGFRYYKVTLESGTEVDVYITHMDASVNYDDKEDMRVRKIQMKQIVDAINANHNGRPIVLMGDTNCHYDYDDINGNLLDAINNEGEKTITDVWTYMGKPGKDIWDKVFFINYKTGKQIRPLKYDVDATPKLSDHDPVSVTFALSDTPSAITEVEASDVLQDDIAGIYSADGAKRVTLQKGMNIVRLRDGSSVKIVK